MTNMKMGKFLISQDLNVINIYRRAGSCIENYIVYDNGVTYYEKFDHEDEFECFQNWQGLVESLEQEQIIWEGAL